MITINPQIGLQEHYYAKIFSEITGISLNEDWIGHRNSVLYYIKNCTERLILIIANIRSKDDI